MYVLDLTVFRDRCNYETEVRIMLAVATDEHFATHVYNDKWEHCYVTYTHRNSEGRRKTLIMLK